MIRNVKIQMHIPWIILDIKDNRLNCSILNWNRLIGLKKWLFALFSGIEKIKKK